MFTWEREYAAGGFKMTFWPYWGICKFWFIDRYGFSFNESRFPNIAFDWTKGKKFLCYRCRLALAPGYIWIWGGR